MNTKSRTEHRSRRTDKKIKEDICDFLAQVPLENCSEIKVHVDSGTVTLRGNVNKSQTKRTVEEIAEHVAGVNNIQNELRIQARRTKK